MCGFAGIWRIGCSSPDDLEPSVRLMARALRHRGPDDSGVWSDSAVSFSLGHQRLSVQDLSPAGHQPMHSASGRYVIAFNGEIYNHLELRQQLESTQSLRQPWNGHSDTETFLALVDAWGLHQALERSAGMFAFALWDRAKRRLHLARDRFGEKPLYWGLIRQGRHSAFAFASDLVAFRALPDLPRFSCNPSAIHAYFQLGCIPAPLCIYEGLNQLQPGYTAQIDYPNQPVVPQAWWDTSRQSIIASSSQSAVNCSSQAYLELLEHTLQQVIAEQALSDVPLGSFLSGGIDSSLITALLQVQCKRPVRSFTIAFPDNPGFDEAPYAAAVAAHLGTDHTEFPLTVHDVQSLIPKLPQLYTEPFADSSQLPTYLVCREARRSGLTVALSGDGGDELFGGYNRHSLLPALHHRFGRWPLPLRHLAAWSLEQLPVSSRGLYRDKRYKLAAALRSAGSLEDLHHSVVSVWSEPDLDLLKPTFPSKHAFPLSYLPEAPTPSEQLMLADALLYLPSDILVKVDRASMASSLETRAPFLDHRVASLAWQLPLSLKISPDGTNKWALRQILYRHVPRQLFDRPKAGFAMPIGEWLRGPLRHWVHDQLDPVQIEAQGYLRTEKIQKIWLEHLAGRDHTSRLWTVLMWQAWIAEWCT